MCCGGASSELEESELDESESDSELESELEPELELSLDEEESAVMSKLHVISGANEWTAV